MPGIAQKRKFLGEQQIGIFKITRVTKGTEAPSLSNLGSAGSRRSQIPSETRRRSHKGPLRESRINLSQEPPVHRPSQATQTAKTPERHGTRDELVPLTEQETPKIMRNRTYRGEPSSLPSTPSSARRRSSFNMRGKRISSAFSSSGVITLPHSSVASSSLFKHIDPELPEDDRFRQLLIWVASRSMDSSRSSSNQNQASTSSLPQLQDGGAELLKEVQEELIRQLADKTINLVPEEGEKKSSWELKENEQNVRNRARERLFTEQIEERKTEDAAWVDAARFYDSYQTSALSALKETSRAKRGQRATSQERGELGPRPNELPETFRCGYDVAREMVEMGLNVGKGDCRLPSLTYKEDSLHNSLTIAQRFVHIVERNLNQHFSHLSDFSAQRSLPPITLTTPKTGEDVRVPALSNYLPLSCLPSARRPGPDPHELLCAISLMDTMRRPRGQMGDAARRAVKDVQRVQQHQQELQRAAAAAVGLAGADNEASNGVVARSGRFTALKRKFTDVPPSTPRRLLGSSRRARESGTAIVGCRMPR